MKKIAISLAALAVVASAASADLKSDTHDQGGAPGVGEGVLDCSGAASLTCGDGASGPLGPGGTVGGYGCTTLLYDGAEEAVAEVCIGADGVLAATMNYAHNSYNDLDLFLLGSCDPGDCLDASLGTSGVEDVSANVAAGTYYVVVDGWNGLADGSGYDLGVSCDVPCSTPTNETTWGGVKSIYAQN